MGSSGSAMLRSPGCGDAAFFEVAISSDTQLSSYGFFPEYSFDYSE